MKDHQLRAFLQVAETGSIRSAARALYLSQTALSKALRELETSVGTELLSRSYRGIQFTEAGHVLLRRARLAVSSLEKAREEISYLRRTKAAKLAIATTPLVAIEVLPQVLRQFEVDEPHAEVTLAEGLLTTVMPDLIEGRIDFALALANALELPREIDFEPLQMVESLPAGRIGNPILGAESWSDLRGSKWVLNLSSGSQGQMFLSWLEGKGVKIGEVIRCTSPHLMAELMRRTDALGFCPRILLEDQYYGVGLRPLKVRPFPPPVELGLLTRHGSTLSQPAQHLCDLFRRVLTSKKDLRRA